MSFSTSPIQGPAKVEGALNGASQAASDAKARAIAALTGQAAPVDQNNVRAEDLGSIKTSEKGQAASTEAAAPTEETKAAPEASKPAETPLSAQYAQLARKEKALRAQVQQLKAEQAAFEAAKAAVQKPSTPEVDLSQYVPKERLTKEALQVLAEAGVSYEQLTEQALNGPTLEAMEQKRTISTLQAKIDALEKAQEKAAKTFEETQTNSYKQAVAQIKAETSKLVFTDPAFETIKATNSVNDVVDLIESTFRDGLGPEHPKGTLLTVEEAAQMVEDHLLEEAIKITQIKKVQERLKAASPSASVKTPGTEKQANSVKTLTNAISNTRQLTARERAIAVAQGRDPK